MHCTSGNALGQAVLTLLHRCEAAMLDVAQAIAVLGDCTSPAIIAEFLDSEAEATLRVIAQLDSTGLMLSSRFRHESIRHAILAHMTRDERAAAHGKATRVLRAHGAPAAVLARHLLAADRIDPAWAAPVLLEGSRLALGDGDVDLACLYLRRAYDACGSDPRQAAIKSAIVRAEWRIDPAIAARHLPDLINSQHGRHLTDPDFAMLINHVLWHGPTDEAADTLNQLVGLVPEAAGETYSNAARLLFSCIYPELAGHVRRQEILAASTGTEPSATPLHLRAAFVLATVLTADGGEEEAVRGAEEILRVLHLNDSTVIPKTLALLSLAFLGKLEQAASWCHALLCEARQAPTWHALLAGVQAIIDLQYGDFINAEKHASAALDLLPAESAGIATGGPLASRLLAEVAQGKYTDAAVLLRLPVPKAMFQSLYGLRYLHARGRYYLSVSNLTAALADFESCGELMTRWQLEISIVPWRIDAAHAWLRMGDAQRARELANDQLARLRPSQSRLHGMCLRVLALTGDPRDRATLLGSAVESLQKAADRFETACALADLSEAYQALGEVDKARVAARRAIHLAEKCGAAPLESRIAAQAEITRQDIPIDMRLLDDLSGAERRVATLAADGYSNREISRKLHITVSTVEQHLTRVYRKLRVNRRVDLPHELSSTLREPWEASGLPDG
jgi:ATP/maltotriose-dependent transcriptional regulator MalT